jgi:hypothetical protein
MQKRCSKCSQMAEYSLVFVLSTVGNTPRLQKCSRVVLFCDDCLREPGECLCTDELRKAVNSAYTELHQRSRRRSTQSEWRQQQTAV